MPLADTFKEFSELLGERLGLGVCTTEDSIRYTFYTALLSSGRFRHTDVILEHPHPVISGAKIDTIIRGVHDRQPVAVEFKYDRANPGGKNQNKTHRAGAVVNDIFRLARIPNSLATVRYFVYVTDAEMAGYFRNPSNRLEDLFDVSGPARFALNPSVFSRFPKTFVTCIESLACDCQVRSVFAADLPVNHHVRAFEVLTV